MKLSVSINIVDILNSKGDIFERVFARHELFKKTNKISEILLLLKESGITGVELVLSTKTKDRDIILIKKYLKNIIYKSSASINRFQKFLESTLKK